MAYLYCLTSPSGKQYIGIAKNYIKRWGEHVGDANRGGKLALHKAIRKYGWGRFSKQILVEGSVDYVKEMEVLAIARFETFSPKGYNLTTGGDGGSGIVHSSKTILRIAASNKGKRRSLETCQKLRESRLGKSNSEESKAKVAKSLSELPRSEEWSLHISNAKKGKPQSASAKAARTISQKAKWDDPIYKAQQLEKQRLGRLKQLTSTYAESKLE